MLLCRLVSSYSTTLHFTLEIFTVFRESIFEVQYSKPRLLKIGNLPFWSKLERFDRGINIEHKQIPKNIVTEEENYHGTQHSKRSPKALNLVQNCNFSILSAIFVTIATVKFE